MPYEYNTSKSWTIGLPLAVGLRVKEIVRSEVMIYSVTEQRNTMRVCWIAPFRLYPAEHMRYAVNVGTHDQFNYSVVLSLIFSERRLFSIRKIECFTKWFCAPKRMRRLLYIRQYIVIVPELGYSE